MEKSAENGKIKNKLRRTACLIFDRRKTKTETNECRENKRKQKGKPP